MRLRIKILLLLCGIFHTYTYAQRYTVRGYVRDAESGETLQGATVAVPSAEKILNSNTYGFFSFTLIPKKYRITCSYVGYLSYSVELDLRSDTILNIELQKSSVMAGEVVVTARKREDILKSAQMGKISLDIEQIRTLPALMGEVDIIRSLLLLPGVTNAGEASAGIYVRGGGPDQNLILLDDAVVYNSGHLFGFFSIFNSDAIKNVTLIKGGMPAQYGGRLSSVLDISMKEGNLNELTMEGGIGLIASRFSLQGPIKKEKSSFMISARRTYADAIAKPFIPKSSNFYGSGYYFYDANAKFNYIFSERDRLYVSGYFGRDVFDFVNTRQSFRVNVPWGNATATVRWNHVFNKKLFANTTAVFNDYRFSFNGAQNNLDVKLSSGIRDLGIKHDLDLFTFSGHCLKFGGQYTYHRFTPSVISGRQDSVEFQPNNPQTKFGHEAAVYLQDEWDVNPDLKIQAGMRYSVFRQAGPYKVYETDANGNRTDSTVYGRGDNVKTYGGLEPRLALRYSLNDNSAVKASVSRNRQYIHLVSNAGTTLPTDIWVPSTLRVKPQLSWLYALGYFRNFENNSYEASVEFFYKDMLNQIEYKDGFTPNSLEDVENSFVFGKGWSYGMEWFISKKKGRLTGWLGYTLSRTWREFPDLNEGKKYPAKFDRRHDLSLVAMYTINKKWKMAATFVYATGNATTLPTRLYFMEGVLSQEFSSMNQYRLPAYHRTDISFTYSSPKNEKRKLKSEWVFSVYNLYSRQNPYFIYFDQEADPAAGTIRVQAKQVSIFPIIPSVTWNFKF